MWREVGRTDRVVLAAHAITGHGYYITLSAWEGHHAHGSPWAARVIADAVRGGRVAGVPTWSLPSPPRSPVRVVPEDVRRRGQVHGADRWRRPRAQRDNKAQRRFAGRRRATSDTATEE